MVEVLETAGVRLREAFAAAVAAPDGLGRRVDGAQQAAVDAPCDQSLFLVAGPGSGKTTVLTLRILKLILVDGLPPDAILATTFTRKAAAELRSRVLDWGETMRARLLRQLDPRDPAAAALRRLDFGLVTNGTLDGIAQTILSDFRPAGAQPPVAVQEFVVESLLLRHGLWREGRHRNADLLDYAEQVDGFPSLTQGKLVGLCREVRERILHDMVDASAFFKAAGAKHPGAPLLGRVVADFAARLDGAPLVDFAGLEDLLRVRIERGELERFVAGPRAVLVDEYQDTNLLQEAIYFGLAGRACAASGSVAVVGDDDQALYRFRGATVELFRDFPERLRAGAGVAARTIHLARNYRSAPAIVAWCSDFAELDPGFRPVRVGGKPSLVPARPDAGGLPVLGLFRPDVERLAADLARLIGDVFRGPGVALPGGRTLARHPEGDVGDCAVLFGSPKERTARGTPRLPGLLRVALARPPDPIAVHNPRGAALHALPHVAALCGLMLACIDPGAAVQRQAGLPAEVRDVFFGWRRAGEQIIAHDPAPPGGAGGGSLGAFVVAWQRRAPQARGLAAWPRETPLAHLLYQLVAWFPRFQSDPLALAHLEVIARVIAHAAQFNRHRATIERDPPGAEKSIRSALWLVFKPLAEGELEPEEELVGALPRDKVNVLSIHQAKGLEFPLVVVDVGSEFKDHWPGWAFKRFPVDGARAHRLEDALRPFSPLGPPRRDAVDRAFDDLVRQYFVAFSRAQDALLLVGLGSPTEGPRAIPNVATGWTRDGAWPWRGRPELVLI